MDGPAAVGRDRAPTLALTLLAWTNPWHHLYWTAIANERIGEFWIAMPEYGPGFRAHFIYCYALVAVATFLLARAVYRSSGVFRPRARSCSSVSWCHGW